ncbi:MAG: actin-binding WH2 domain-containing protein [Anaerolineales bacterium]|uniref:actin-binding WH2 domain-containing protein n=1 Tax=Candidatus Villigracilis proximus TaxID=3140683 RepID=UPI0031362E18|nr:actin-binding WH2 domain-containing protein [Anaerolineales bacterium]
MQNLFSIMPDFLRDPDAFFHSIQRDENVRSKALSLGLVALFSFMIYGFMLGLAKSPLQALSSSVKVPVLFLSTMLFCLPALYFFSLALLGTPLKMMQVLTMVLSGISVTAFLLLGLAPITLFFVLTSGNYEFFQLLAVIFVGISACIGVYFLWRGMTLVEPTRTDALNILGKRILFLWVLVYGFVGTQMTWRLSPFVGKPNDPFYWIRPSRDNFYVDVIKAIQGALNLPASDASWLMPLIFGGICIVGLGVVFFAGGMLIGNASKKSAPKVETPQVS